jgi:hypothetical protein
MAPEVLNALMLRDWSVRVLDAWTHYGRWWLQQLALVQLVTTRDGKETTQNFEGDTPDAARLAAAEAVFPTLDADVRATLGERP